jgi:hypothetical protein
MVTFRIVSEYSEDSPSNESGLRIEGGPLYDLVRIQRVALQKDSVRLWTRKSKVNAADLNLDTGDIAQWLQALQPSQFRNSEWCTDGASWAACDAYVIQRNEWVAAAHKYMLMVYFLKFALSKTGALVLIVSCHTSG